MTDNKSGSNWIKTNTPILTAVGFKYLSRYNPFWKVESYAYTPAHDGEIPNVYANEKDWDLALYSRYLMERYCFFGIRSMPPEGRGTFNMTCPSKWGCDFKRFDTNNIAVFMRQLEECPFWGLYALALSINNWHLFLREFPEQKLAEFRAITLKKILNSVFDEDPFCFSTTNDIIREIKRNAALLPRFERAFPGVLSPIPDHNKKETDWRSF